MGGVWCLLSSYYVLRMLADAMHRGITGIHWISEERHLIQAENIRESFLVEVMPNLNVEEKLGIHREAEKGKSRVGMGRWRPGFGRWGWGASFPTSCPRMELLLHGYPGLQQGQQISARRWGDRVSWRQSRCGKCMGLIKHSAASKRNKCPQGNTGSSW